MENLHIIQANSEDCEALAPFAARMFTHTFGHLYRPENLADHLARAYSAATFREALAAGDTILLMKSGDAILGYAKVGHVALPVLGREAKVEALIEITAARGLTPADVMAVGDGANDLGMLQLAGAGVAAHAKPAVAAQVSIRINHADLTGLLYLQGYAAEEFVN